jgi:hypothetical protein
VVVTDRVAVTGVTPSAGVTDAGEIVHVASAGAPAQASDTAVLNPPRGVTVTVTLPEAPWFTFNVAGAETSKSQPDPVSAIICGLLLALWVIVRVPWGRAPKAVGENVTLIVQVAPEATLLPQVFVWAKSLGTGVIAMAVIVKAALPLFVRVTVCAALVVVRNCPPKARFVGATTTTGTKVSFATNASEGPLRVD